MVNVFFLLKKIVAIHHVLKCNASCSKMLADCCVIASMYIVKHIQLCIQRKVKQQRDIQTEKRRRGGRGREMESILADITFAKRFFFLDRNTYFGYMPKSTSSAHSLIAPNHSVLSILQTLLLRNLIHQNFRMACNSTTAQRCAFSICARHILKGQKSLPKIEEYLNENKCEELKKNRVYIFVHTMPI